LVTGSGDYHVLAVGAYPLNREKVAALVERCDRVLVLEEGYPIIEEHLRGLLDRDVKVQGRLDGTVPRDGELNPAIVAAALGLKASTGRDVPALVRQRPPSFCKGCGHADLYSALAEVMAEAGPEGFSQILAVTPSERCRLTIWSIPVLTWAPPSQWPSALQMQDCFRLWL
jgi:indolepyruvate ferredoxin oxidoreductase, alpha subunit